MNELFEELKCHRIRVVNFNDNCLTVDLWCGATISTFKPEQMVAILKAIRTAADTKGPASSVHDTKGGCRWIKVEDCALQDAQWYVVNTEYGVFVQCWDSAHGWQGVIGSIPRGDVTHCLLLPEV